MSEVSSARAETGSVTCVIPTHGRPADLAEALRSVLAQAVPVASVLVVDDVGDAETRELVRTAAAGGAPVRVLANPHGTGASSSRNAGARAATTTFVGFLDDDDRWRASFVERTTACARASGADLVLAGIERYRLDGRRQAMVAPAVLAPDLLLSRNPGVTGSNLLVRREAFLAAGGFDERLPVYNDWDMLICSLAAGLRHAVVPELLVEWREHSGERLSTMSARRADGVEAFLAKHRHRMSPQQQRDLQAVALGIRRRAAPGLGTRVRATWDLARLRGRPAAATSGPELATPDRPAAAGEAPDPTTARPCSPPRLLFPQSRDGVGGSVVTGAVLARDLQASGRWSPVAVVNGEGPVADYHRGLGLPVVRLDESATPHTPRPDDGNAVHRALKRVRIAHRAERYLRRHPVDLVHVHDESSALGWGLAARRRGIPMVWHVHQQLPQRVDPLLLRLSAHVVFVADANRVRFGPAGTAVPSTTVPNTVDTVAFAPAERPRPAGPVRLAFVSNLVERKRPEWAVRAGALLLEQGLDVEVLVVGADFTGSAVEALVSSPAGRRLGDRLHCPGPSQDVAGVLQGVDVLLLPSMRDREAFPRIVVEAMSCAVPVVATSVAGVPEAVVDGVTGRLVDPDDFDGFCEAVGQLVRSPELRRSMGAAARSRVLERFAADRNAERFERLYDALLRPPARA